MSRRLSPEARREQLLEASIRTFARLGYGGTRVEDLAAEAGVANSLFSQHWPTKEAIFLDARDRVRRESLEIAREAIERSSPKSSADHLRVVVVAVVTWYADHPDRIGVFLDEPELQDERVDVADTDLVADLVFRDVDPGLAPFRRISNLAILWCLRAVVDQMHRLVLEPAVVAQTISIAIVGALDGVARQLGGRLDGADDLLAHIDAVRGELGPSSTADQVALELSRRPWPELLQPAEPPPWAQPAQPPAG